MSENRNEKSHELSSLRPIRNPSKDVGNGWKETLNDAQNKEGKIGGDSKSNR